MFCDSPRKLNLSLALHCLGRGLSSSSTLGYSWPTRSTALGCRPPFDDSETQTSDLAIVRGHDEDDYQHHHSKTATRPALGHRFKPPSNNAASIIHNNNNNSAQKPPHTSLVSHELLATGAHCLAASGEVTVTRDIDDHFCARNSVCQIDPVPYRVDC